ncbi:DNA mismatch repair endonuclease MutL [Desulfobacter hydrogenophilus]|uniref:DNA mismatch repair protein MutL n=1 Tax=Desulfobacter hydrogenophilus TaxID=2291 RepID=A0A328FCQ9_9BACT|nr:DNA mismatch repair endonuclease MutL [Desulfobacter hydrogenophilus]NDY73264.1 DNA mismatch repair endonuclease MutL [Desulfobacter hydrogenophilus]QBH13840.1 DNA mismatch repair endonuclease MutL [Desulfobacter hydrogenophilus]RAM00855.1 DNA mismatch repair endonuclease MutL [Desulfobacter hydrogenophilus]
MSRIRILPDLLSNQIAAGEVVQRPVSVVKELVENAMDAGADRIIVEIENGGKTLIRVSDNGCGLSRDEAVLALERYATSKIYTKEDLFSISTFGFRGEALPSIASVSKFSFVSRTADNAIGTRVDMNGGKLSGVTDTGAPVGTMVEVRRLFFNTPARRKFLKSENTEAGHIADALAGLAMGNPGVGFRLVVNRRSVKSYPPGQSLFQRAQMVLGKEVADQLYEMQWPKMDEDGDSGLPELCIRGVCANPGVTRSTANRIFLFVNRRLVYDRGLVAAMFQGYRGRIMKGRYPVGAVCVELPCDQVDVNVHPTKREIKFITPGPVYQALSIAVANALSRGQDDKLSYARAVMPQKKDSPMPVQAALKSASLSEQRLTPDLFESASTLQSSTVYDSFDSPAESFQAAEAREKSWTPVPETKLSDQAPVAGHEPQTSDQGITAPLSEPEPFQATQSGFRVVGQVLNIYIVVEKQNHLILVDQHAAHERIVFEQLLNRYKHMDVQSQSLVVPEVLELSHKEALVLDSIMADLADLGIKVEPFGGTSFVIKAVPVLVEEKQVGPMVVEMVEKISHANGTGLKNDWLEDALATMACHRSVRGGQSMSLKEMTALVAQLFTCENPMHCPHGRPVFVSFDARSLEKLFKRLV